jgi:hypothetical protein
MASDYAENPADCWQCRAIARPCHFHRTRENPAMMAAWAARERRIVARRLAREHPNAGYLPHERADVRP